jgi:membrane protein involved in colicin uptake
MVKKKAKKKATPKKAATKKLPAKKVASKKAKPVAKKSVSKRTAAKKRASASPPNPAVAPTSVDSIEGGWDGGVDDVSGAAEPLDGFDEAGI